MLKKDNAPKESVPENAAGRTHEANENQNIRKVREILFGKNINDFEKRFTNLEELLTNEVITAKKQTQTLYDNLEQYLKAEVSSINQNISKKEEDLAAEIRNLSDSVNSLKRSLSSFEESSTSQFRKDYESLVRKNEELLGQLQKEGKSRIENIQSIENEINVIKGVLTSQDSSVKEIRNNIFKQIFDQQKLMEQKFEDEAKLRTTSDDDLRALLDSLSARLINFRSESDKSFGELKSTVKDHDASVNSQIPETLRNMERRNSDTSREIKIEIEDILAKLNSFAGKTTTDFKDMRESVHTQVKNIRMELEQQNLRLSQKLRSEQDVQRQQKVDRNSLALMFSELAMRLGDDVDSE